MNMSATMTNDRDYDDDNVSVEGSVGGAAIVFLSIIMYE